MNLLDPQMDALKYEIQEEFRGARIKVIGVGGGGSNAVARMVSEGVEGVEFYALNTDMQALLACNVPNKIQIGGKITGGLGAGADPAIGRQAALEDTDRLCEMLEGTDMAFVTAGLGGGTGTGACPVVASLAKELGALTVAVVTKPFKFEGSRRMRSADAGLADLAATVDTVIAIPNDRLLSLVPKGTSFTEGFRVADDILRQAVQGISDIMVTPGMINRDFSDIKATMAGMGYAVMGTATARGETATVEAARRAISCPLLEDSRIKGSRGILINITGSSQLGLHEVNEACEIVRSAAEFEDVMVNFGVIINESMGDAVKVTVIATGFQPEIHPVPLRRTATPEIKGKPAAVSSFNSAATVEVPAPDPLAPAMMAHEEMPEPAAPEPASMELDFDPDDLEVPAFLRQGRLLQ
ncbi:MAG: cell division protein FtsZ [Bryobacteraceae bacterium]